MNEVLYGWGGADPDDVAVVLCASIIAAGRVPRLSFRVEGTNVVSIRVLRSEHDRWLVVADLPCHPMTEGPWSAGYEKSILLAASDLEGKVKSAIASNGSGELHRNDDVHCAGCSRLIVGRLVYCSECAKPDEGKGSQP